MCIPKTYKCDGEYDCGPMDQSDEKNCPGTKSLTGVVKNGIINDYVNNIHVTRVGKERQRRCNGYNTYSVSHDLILVPLYFY